MQIIAKDAESKLLEMASRLKGAEDGCYAINFNFSKLAERYRSVFQLKIATNIINDIFKKEDGAIYSCKDSDVVVVYLGNDETIVGKCIYQLRYLFSDDPLAYKNEAEGIENEDFCNVFVLRYQWREFISFCKKKLSNGAEEDIEKKDILKKSLFLPEDLVSLQRDLANIDFAKVLRTQAICARTKTNIIKPVFYELYVSISHLRAILNYEIDFKTDKLLFRYLTRMLDDYLIELLKYKKDTYLNGPTSINLNVTSVLSDDFIALDKLLSSELKSAIVIELHISDIFNDLAEFYEAKSYLQSRGYRVCVDGVNNYNLHHIDRDSLDVDLVKIKWNQDLEAELEGIDNIRFADKIARLGSNRVIVSRCDSKYAIDKSRMLGVSLFQGFYVDKMLKPAYSGT